MEKEKRIKLDLKNHIDLKDKTYQVLKKAIIGNYFKPNEKITERYLSKIMGVSTSPIKHALNRLEYEGFVINVPRRGRKIADISLKLKEYSLIRAALEGVAINIATEKASSQDLNDLQNILDKMNKAMESEDLNKLIKLNICFHEKIYEISKNNLIKPLINTIRILYDSLRSNKLKERDKIDNYIGFREHQEIVNSMKNRNREDAEVKIKKHIIRSDKHFIDKIKERKSKIGLFSEITKK